MKRGITYALYDSLVEIEGISSVRHVDKRFLLLAVFVSSTSSSIGFAELRNIELRLQEKGRNWNIKESVESGDSSSCEHQPNGCGKEHT